MKNQSKTDLESQLCTLYTTQQTHYDDALQVARSLPDAFVRNGGTSQQALQQLAGSLDKVAQIDNQIVPLRAEWEASGRPAGASLRRVFENIQRAIEQLLELMAVAENHAEQAKKRLAPELDVATRRNRMLRAYNDTIKRT